MIRTRLAPFPALIVSAAALLAGPQLRGQGVPGVTYVDQPTGIPFGTYVSAWPGLQPYIGDLAKGLIAQTRQALELSAANRRISDGELNLLAQLQWQRGALDKADLAVDRALAINRGNSLNTFQLALVSFAHLRRASGPLDKWKWQRRTMDAYALTLSLDANNVAARYYLAYSYMNTPSIAGGDKSKALELADKGLALKHREFIAVRADAHRLLGHRNAAARDYDAAISLKIIKLGGLVDASFDAMKQGELGTAKKYLDFAVFCRSDSALVHEALGDYYVLIHDTAQARKAYQLATQKSDSDLAPHSGGLKSAERKLRALQR